MMKRSLTFSNYRWYTGVIISFSERKLSKFKPRELRKGFLMTILNFTVPPLPEYINSGLTRAPIHSGHPNRKNIGIFDLLVVMKGSSMSRRMAFLMKSNPACSSSCVPIRIISARRDARWRPIITGFISKPPGSGMRTRHAKRLEEKRLRS